jgi:hypothetical protein
MPRIFRYSGNTEKNDIAKTSNYREIIYPNHGFIAGNGVAHIGESWVKSSTTNLDNGLCIKVIDSDKFLLACGATCYEIPNHGYPINQILYVGTTPGVFTTSPPAANQTPLIRLLVGWCPTPNEFIYQPNLEPK